MPADNDPRAVIQRLFSAMQAVPEGWMVRHVRAGSSDLKAGPGWRRVRSLRHVHVQDMRTIECAATLPDGHDSVFGARPWVASSHWVVGDDPHRHGTPFAGLGAWPAEWRALPESFHFEQVRAHPQMTGAVEDLPDFIKQDPEMLRKTLVGRAGLARFPKHLPSCTLDFIETETGPVLLEGGPACTPFGSAHACGFAGVGGKPYTGADIRPYGVAFRLMPHVLLADPDTWEDGDHTGCILDWPDVDRLAASNQVDASPTV